MFANALPEISIVVEDRSGSGMFFADEFLKPKPVAVPR